METIVSGLLSNLIPSWVWVAIGWWPYILTTLLVIGALALIRVVFKAAGWPGITAMFSAIALAIGYVLGRGNVHLPTVPEEPVKPVVKKVTKKRKTIFDNWKK